MTATKPSAFEASHYEPPPPPVCLEKCSCAAQAALEIEIVNVHFVSLEKRAIPSWLGRFAVWVIRRISFGVGIVPSVSLTSRLMQDGRQLTVDDHGFHRLGGGIKLDVWLSKPCGVAQIPAALVDLAARQMLLKGTDAGQRRN